MAEPLETLPCGCQMGTVNDAFVFRPHALDCTYYLYVLEQTAAQGKPTYTVQEN